MSATPQDVNEYADRMLAALDSMYAENAPAATKRHLLKAVLALFRDESLASRAEERTGTPCKHIDGPCECGPEGFGLRDDDPRVNASLAEPPREGDYDELVAAMQEVAKERGMSDHDIGEAGDDASAVEYVRALFPLSAPSPSEPTREAVTFSGFIPANTAPSDTVASSLLAHISRMRRDGSFADGASLCWSPDELERLAMFAIDAAKRLAAPVPSAASAREEDRAHSLPSRGYFNAARRFNADDPMHLLDAMEQALVMCGEHGLLGAEWSISLGGRNADGTFEFRVETPGEGNVFRGPTLARMLRSTFNDEDQSRAARPDADGER